MRSLKLTLEDLTVDSFDTTPREGARAGTVYGHESYLSECRCTGGWCEGESTTPCQAGTYGGNTCESTCNQIACGCTGYPDTCDISCNGTCQWNGGETCYNGCVTYLGCPTEPGYQGC